MSVEEENETDIDEEIDILFDTLSKEDFKNLLSAAEIRDNFETINEILEPLRDAENEFQNPSLKINKTVRSKIQIITPKKELDNENSNLIKDILSYQKCYEKNADKTNNTIDEVKESFKGLSESVTSLIELIEKIKKIYFDHAKLMMSPITKKEENLKNFDKKKLSGQKLKDFETKNKKLDEKVKIYDKNLAKIIKGLKEVFKRINKNIKGYLDLLNKLDRPINSLVEEIEEIFSQFEDKSKELINIIYNTPNKKEQSSKIFIEIEKLNNKIIKLIEEKIKELGSHNKALQNEKEKCSKDFKDIKKLESESSKKIKELEKETKTIISEVNEILKICSLPKIEADFKEFKGLPVDKVGENITQGTNIMLKKNEKLEVNIGKLKTFVEENIEITRQAVTLDLAFIMDITGSMKNYLQFAKDKILTIVEKITRDTNIIVRLGFVGYRDYVDSKEEYLIYPELTKNTEKVKEFISSAKEGGGHNAEDMGCGLQQALNYEWKSNTRFAILLADAPCHGEQYHEIKDFDSLPKGDPKFKIDKLIQQYAENNINLMCLNLTPMTVKLYNNFVDYYQKGRKNESSIYVGIFNEDKEDSEKLVDLIVKNAKKYYEKRHGT